MSHSALPPSHPPQNYNENNLTPSMAIFMVVIFGFILTISLLSVYLRNCTWPFLRSNSNPSPPPNEQRPHDSHLGLWFPRAVTMPTPDRGLSLEDLQTLPAFLFSDVKVLHKGNDELECAVCLNKFQDNEVLRFLPGCSHVFHPQCVDRWLATRPTCPICRANVLAATTSHQYHDYYSFIGCPFPSSDSDHEPSNQHSNQTLTNHDQVYTTTTTAAAVVDQIEAEPVSNCVPGRSQEQINAGGDISSPQSTSIQLTRKTLVRSHSTGHSISQLPMRQNEQYPDRFTLRLPEELIRYRLASPQSKIGSGQEGSGDKLQKAAPMPAASTPGRGLRKGTDRPWGFSWTPPPFQSRVNSPMMEGRQREREREENLTSRLKSLVKFRLPPSSDHAVGNASRLDLGERSSDKLWLDGQV